MIKVLALALLAASIWAWMECALGQVWDEFDDWDVYPHWQRKTPDDLDRRGSGCDS